MKTTYKQYLLTLYNLSVKMGEVKNEILNNGDDFTEEERRNFVDIWDVIDDTSKVIFINFYKK